MSLCHLHAESDLFANPWLVLFPRQITYNRRAEIVERIRETNKLDL